jgi:hypothetical protein
MGIRSGEQRGEGLNHIQHREAARFPVEKSLGKTGIFFGRTGQPVFVLATSSKNLLAQAYELSEPSSLLKEFSSSTHIIDKSFVAAVQAFFQIGGRKLTVLPIAIDVTAEDLAAEFRMKLIGSDGGFGKRFGLQLLKDYDACGDLLAFPQAAIVMGSEELASFYQEVQMAIEKRRQHFLLIDPPCYSETEKLRVWARAFQSEMSGVFFPWVSVPGVGLTPVSILAAALIQITDSKYSIATSPANQVLSAELELVKELSKSEIDDLHRSHVNVFRRKANSDLVLWGSSTTSKEGGYHSLIHLSRSLASLQDAFERVTESHVLEARTQTTCDKIQRSLEGFLENCQRDGLLVSRGDQKAYRLSVELKSAAKGDWDSSISVQVELALESADRFIGFRQDIS